MKPLVSIIVPNYNHFRFLKERLTSIYNQTYTNFEVILLDDSSTDNSIEILKEYENHKKTSHLIINKKNSGSPFLQWKKGIELAKGDFVWIAESDDFSSINFLEVLITPLIKNEKIGLSYCQSIIINEESKELYNNAVWTKDLDDKRWDNDFENIGKDECVNFLLFKNTIPNASAVVFKKSLIQTFPNDFKLAGDWVFWISMLLTTNISFKSYPLNYFRQHKNTTRQHNSENKIKTRINEELRIIKYLKPNISLEIFNTRVTSTYQRYLKTLPLKKLVLHFFNPYNSFVIKLNYSKIVLLNIKELLFRLNKKTNHA